MTLRIFLSHSHKDNTWCDAFVDELSKYDTDIWYDRQGLYAGAQWVRTIEDELFKRDIFLIILTPEAWASEWVREELALAFASKKRIIGIIHKQTQLSGFITQRQMIDVTNQNPNTAIKSVTSSLGLTLKAAPVTTIMTTPATTSLTGTWISNSWDLMLTQTGNNITGNGIWRTMFPLPSGGRTPYTLTGTADGKTLKLYLINKGTSPINSAGDFIIETPTKFTGYITPQNEGRMIFTKRP